MNVLNFLLFINTLATIVLLLLIYVLIITMLNVKKMVEKSGKKEEPDLWKNLKNKR